MPQQLVARADTPANLAAAYRVAPIGHALAQILRGPPHEDTVIPKWNIWDPQTLRAWGFYRSIGAKQARSHWRLELPDGQEVHVQEQDDHYAVHWDHVSLRRDPIGHGLRDAPSVMRGLGLAARALRGKGGAA